MKQKNKVYDYYGAAGIIDKVDGYLFNERLLLIGEDGANLLSRVKDNAFFAEGKYWVNNHAHVIDVTRKPLLNYIELYINSISLDPYITGSAQPKLNQDNLNSIPVPLPPFREQCRIKETIEKWQTLIDVLHDYQNELFENITQIKSKVLDLAIHGKLVPQEPSDEPAIEQLKRVNPSFLPSHNLHYEGIPNNWAECTLSDVCSEFIVPQRDKPKKFDGNIPWCRIEDIEGKYLNGSLSNRLVTQETIKEMNMRICPVGTVICSCSASIGTQAIVTRACCTNQTFIGLVCDSRLMYNEYLYYFLASQKEKFLKIGTGTTIKYISREKFEEYHITLPPKAEQERIVATIELIFKALSEIQASIES